MRAASLAAVSMMIAACGTLQGVPSSDAAGDAAPPSAANDASPSDAGGDADDAEGSAPARSAARYVFVTRATYLPGTSFGSVAEADQRCNDAALQGDPSIREKTFVAWLSDSKSSPATRFVKSTGPYLRVVHDDAIANGWDDLVQRTSSGTLANLLDVDEKGTNLPSGDITTWTGTHADGTADVANDCGDWNKPGGLGTTGDGSESGPRWSDDTTTSCTTGAHLYCFEK